MIGNKKGFVIESAVAIWVVAALIIGAVSFWRGPALIKAIKGSDVNQSKQTEKISESYPVGRLDQRGNFVKMGDYKKSEDRLNLIAVQPPLTWFQKYGWIVILFVIILIAFPTFAISLFNKARANITQIITGVEQAKKELPPASVAILETNLSKKMDTSVKKQVKAIKANIKVDDVAVVTPAVVVTPVK